MATDVFLTRSQLETLFQSVTINMLGLSDMADAWNETGADHSDQSLNPYYFVRISWPTQGAPAFKITEDVCFIRILEADDYYNRQRERNTSLITGDDAHLNEATTFTRIVEAQFVLYGPNSFDHAQAIRSEIFTDENRETLANEGLYLIPDIVAPRRAPELFQGQWWERCDISLRFNAWNVKNKTVNAIESVEISTQSGVDLSNEIVITE